MPHRHHALSWRFILAVPLAIIAAGSPNGHAQLRIATYNVAGLRGDINALRQVLEAAADDDLTGFALAPHVYVFQEVQQSDLAALAGVVDLAAPPGVTYALATYTSDGEDPYGGAQAMFYRDDTLNELTVAHRDLYTGAGRFSDRWLLRLNGYDSPRARFYLYSSHLKASDGESNEQQRLQGVMTLRDDADSLGPGVHVIFAGDMNFYDHQEPGYLEFLSPGNGRAFDPLGSGSWAGSIHAVKHSQSPRTSAEGGLVGGGLDDRFDFILPSDEFDDAEGLALMSATYRSLGNDGDHFDSAINDGDNRYYPFDIPRSNELADALHEASDHLPVVTEVQVPAVMDALLPDSFGRVIRGAEVEVNLIVLNLADVVVSDGADELDFTATASGALLGNADGTVIALDMPAIIALELDTTIVGGREGSVLLESTSEAVQNPLLTRSTSGTILRPANGSFAEEADQDEALIAWTVPTDSGAQMRAVDVFNFGYDALQALLDVDAVIGLEAPFGTTGDLPTGIGGETGTLTLTFETDGLEPGLYEALIELTVSDEDLPGEQISSLTLTVEVTVEDAAPGGDVNGDGFVNILDLLAVLDGWGDCPEPPGACPADLNADGFVDVLDLLLVLDNWG